MLVRLVMSIDDRGLQKELRRFLEDEDVVAEFFDHGHSPWQRIMRSCADVIVVGDALIPEPVESGMAMLNQLPENPTTVVLYSNRQPDRQAALIAAGADVALDSKITGKGLAEAILAVVEARKQYSEKTYQAISQNSLPRLDDFSSENEGMYVFMKEVHQVANSNVPLLILGETGVGKEHLARAIHAESARSSGPFITVNTVAIPEQLLETELFGHRQGAFTGAARSRRGAFEQAHHGTIFLDEIGEMPLSLQAKLLRVLQDFEVKPLGSESSVWVDVRVIAATNLDLGEEVRAGRFRKDLFFRLSVIPLTIPPLRDRREDIPILVRRFLELRRHTLGQDFAVSAEAMEALCSYDWPGNVREMLNVLERALILCEDGEIVLERDLPQVFWENEEGTVSKLVHDLSTDWWSGKSLHEALTETQEIVERNYLESVLQQTGGIIGESARLAGITPRSLYSKMRRHGLAKEDFKRSPGRRKRDS